MMIYGGRSFWPQWNNPEGIKKIDQILRSNHISNLVSCRQRRPAKAREFFTEYWLTVRTDSVLVTRLALHYDLHRPRVNPELLIRQRLDKIALFLSTIQQVSQVGVGANRNGRRDRSRFMTEVKLLAAVAMKDVYNCSSHRNNEQRCSLKMDGYITKKKFHVNLYCDCRSGDYRLLQPKTLLITVYFHWNRPLCGQEIHCFSYKHQVVALGNRYKRLIFDPQKKIGASSLT